jgi:hypothetical protein
MTHHRPPVTFHDINRHRNNILPLHMGTSSGMAAPAPLIFAPADSHSRPSSSSSFSRSTLPHRLWPPSPPPPPSPSSSSSSLFFLFLAT